MYARNASKYNKAVICDQHRKTVTMACASCFLYNCLACDSRSGGLCQGEGQLVNFSSYSAIEVQQYPSCNY